MSINQNIDQNILIEYKNYILWICSLFKNDFPNIHFFDETVNSFIIFLSFYEENKLTKNDLLKIAIAGYISNKVRIIDEEKFFKIPFFIYIQVAQMFMKIYYNIGNDTEKEFSETIKNIVSLKSYINKNI